jgi:hypothetical protein
MPERFNVCAYLPGVSLAGRRAEPLELLLREAPFLRSTPETVLLQSLSAGTWNELSWAMAREPLNVAGDASELRTVYCLDADKKKVALNLELSPAGEVWTFSFSHVSVLGPDEEGVTASLRWLQAWWAARQVTCLVFSGPEMELSAHTGGSDEVVRKGLSSDLLALALVRKEDLRHAASTLRLLSESAGRVTVRGPGRLG